MLLRLLLLGCIMNRLTRVRRRILRVKVFLRRIRVMSRRDASLKFRLVKIRLR